MKIYRGEIRNLIVQDFDLTPVGAKIVKTRNVVLKTDAPFYAGFGRAKISFDYGTVLCTENEAMDYLEHMLSVNPATSVRTCIYATDKFTSEEISRNKFEQLKKTYKEIKKNRD